MIIVEKPIIQDPSGYIKMAYNLVNHGIISMAPTNKEPDVVKPTNYREPGYPVYLALGMWIIGKYNEYPIYKLLKGENTRSLRKFHLLLAGITCIVSAFLLMVLVNNVWALILLYMLIIYYLQSRYVFPFLSEPLATFLLMLFVLTFVLAVKYNKNIYFVFSGITLACLALTKAIYAYLWPLIIVLLFIDWKKKKLKVNKIIVTIIIFIVPYFLITGSWMTRNYLQLGSLSISNGRDGVVMSLRSYLNEMTLSEGMATFLIKSGFMREHPSLFDKLFPDKSDYEKIVNNTYRKECLAGRAKICNEYSFEQGNNILKKEAIKKILSKPVKHILVSIPLMFQMICGHNIFGGILPKRLSGKFIFKRYFEPICIILSIFFLVYYSITRVNIELLAILFPVLYTIGIYGFVSNALPRYVAPLEPFFIIILLITARFIILWLFKDRPQFENLKKKIQHKFLNRSHKHEISSN